MNVVVFTGGNGNANLIKHLKDLSYVNLSEWILEDNLAVRFQVQLHKIIWGEKKGV